MMTPEQFYHLPDGTRIVRRNDGTGGAQFDGDDGQPVLLLRAGALLQLHYVAAEDCYRCAPCDLMLADLVEVNE